MSILDTSIAAASALFTGTAAYSSWKASRQANEAAAKANEAATKANETAATLARIEQERWHKELTPQLRIKLQAEPHEQLYVRFEGPGKLVELHVGLEIQDDFDGSRPPHVVGTLTAEEVAEVVWGPYRFRPEVDGADALGRAVPAFPLFAGGRTRLAVDPSPRPSWYGGADGEQRWRDRYRTAPIRLCELHAGRGATQSPASWTGRRAVPWRHATSRGMPDQR